MAEKILGSDGLERIKSKFTVNPIGATNGSDITDTQLSNGISPDAYKMADLYPDTYATMTTVPAGLDFSKLEIADELFQGCAGITHIDSIDLPNAISASHLFDGCTSLVSIGSINVPKATDLTYMFNGCTALKTLPEFDTSACTDFFCMFTDCASLPTTFPFTLDMSSVNNWHDRTSGKLMLAGTPVTNITIRAVINTEFDGFPSYIDATEITLDAVGNAGTTKTGSWLISGDSGGSYKLNNQYVYYKSYGIIGGTYGIVNNEAMGLIAQIAYNNYLLNHDSVSGTVSIPYHMRKITQTTTFPYGYTSSGNNTKPVVVSLDKSSSVDYTLSIDTDVFKNIPTGSIINENMRWFLGMNFNPNSSLDYATHTKSVDYIMSDTVNDTTKTITFKKVTGTVGVSSVNVKFEGE